MLCTAFLCLSDWPMLPLYAALFCIVPFCLKLNDDDDDDDDLGVIFDSNLTFKDHMAQKINKAYSVLGRTRLYTGLALCVVKWGILAQG